MKRFLPPALVAGLVLWALNSASAEPKPIGPLNHKHLVFNYKILNPPVEGAEQRYQEAIEQAKQSLNSPNELSELITRAGVQQMQTTTQTLTGSAEVWFAPPYHLVVISEGQDLQHKYITGEVAKLGLRPGIVGVPLTIGKVHASLPQFKANYEITTNTEFINGFALLLLQKNDTPEWLQTNNRAVADFYDFYVKGAKALNDASVETFSTGTVATHHVRPDYHEKYIFDSDRLVRIEESIMMNSRFQVANVVKFGYSDHSAIPTSMVVTHYAPNGTLSFESSIDVQSLDTFDEDADLTRFLPARPGDTIKDERISPPRIYAIRTPGFPSNLFGKKKPPTEAAVHPPTPVRRPELPQSAPAAKWMYALAAICAVGVAILWYKGRR